MTCFIIRETKEMRFLKKTMKFVEEKDLETPSTEVRNTMEDLRKSKLFSEEELKLLQGHLQAKSYNKFLLEHAVLAHKNDPRHTIEEWYQAFENF
jgi:hypothetical protein